MNCEVIEKIANAVLYEGYVLYPYRPSSVKNQQRFNFGVLYPRENCKSSASSDNWYMQTECLVLGTAQSQIEVKVRFLQMAERQGSPEGACWQEGIEREVSTPPRNVESISRGTHRQRFAFDTALNAEALRMDSLEGELELRAARLDEGLYKITFKVSNQASLTASAEISRDEVLLRSLVSAHSILHVTGGRFVSPVDVPERYRSAAEECRNIDTWPVMAGNEELADFIVSAPIILYDYPQIAPESPGDLCDGTEIDEILALRILTLTDAEKREVREGDERARLILERTEILPPEHFQKLHGALRAVPSTPQSSSSEAQ